MNGTNDHLLALLITGNGRAQKQAAAELARRNIDVDRLRRDYLPLFTEEGRAAVQQLRSRQQHRSSLEMVTRNFANGDSETAVRWVLDSVYEDWR